MNRDSKSMLISLALHSLIIASGVTLQSSAAHQKKPVVIDFDIANPGPKGEQTRKTPEATKPKEVKVASRNTPRPEAPRQANLPPTPVHTATEAAGPVAVSARPESPTSATEPARVAAGPSEAGQGGSGGSGGSGTSTDALRNRYYREHFEYIKDLVQKSIVYPPRAKKMGWMGKVVVSFIVTESGHTKNQKILKSSGYDLLDNSVLETIRSLEPYPKPPVTAELKIPVTYHLE